MCTISGRSARECLGYEYHFPYVNQANLCATSTIIAFFLVRGSFSIRNTSYVRTTNLLASPAISTNYFLPFRGEYALSSSVVFFYLWTIILTSNCAGFGLVQGFSYGVALVRFFYGVVAIGVSAETCHQSLANYGHASAQSARAQLASPNYRRFLGFFCVIGFSG